MTRISRSAFLILPFGRKSRGIIATLQTWAVRSAQRRALQELPDAMLKDVGLSRADACREAFKPFWRP